MAYVFGNIVEFVNKSDKEKVFYVQHAFGISMEDRWKPKAKVKNIDINTILHRATDGEPEPREWIYIENNIFYCLYCMLFSKNSQQKDDLATIGIDYNLSNSRVSQKVKRHDTCACHKYAKKLYESAVHSANSDSNLACLATDYTNPIRNAVRCIFKVILHLASHGMHKKNSRCFCFLLF